MNLNDCINRLPLILRGRFSSSSNASWLAWAADAIARIERASVGPGNKRMVMAVQSKSGFIAKPPSLNQISDAWLDGEPVASVREKDDRGFPMTPGSVAWLQADAEIDARNPETIKVSFFGVPNFLKGKSIFVGYIDGVAKVGRITGDGEVLQVTANELAGLSIAVGSERMTIETNGATEPDHQLSNSVLVNFDSQSESYNNITAILEDFSEENIDGMAVIIDRETINVVSSSWIRPTKSSTGWSDQAAFSGYRAEPGRQGRGVGIGIAIKSNLVVGGYRRLDRPTTLTEALDLPEGSETLMAAYLRFAAEADQDLSSSEAAKAEAIFNEALRRYTIDQSRTDGATRPTAYQFKVSLSGRRP